MAGNIPNRRRVAMPGKHLCASRKNLAEGEGFEPPVPCGTPVFKTGALNHSAIPPDGKTFLRGFR